MEDDLQVQLGDLVDLGDAKQVTQGPFVPEAIEDNVTYLYREMP